MTTDRPEDPIVPDGGEPPPPTVSATAPAAHPVRWSGRKTAVAAALAIGLTGAGAVAAAAAMPAGQSPTVGDRGGFGPMGGQGGFGPGGQGQQGQGFDPSQIPGQSS